MWEESECFLIKPFEHKKYFGLNTVAEFMYRSNEKHRSKIQKIYVSKSHFCCPHGIPVFCSTHSGEHSFIASNHRMLSE
jgi:hypothetical protein